MTKWLYLALGGTIGTVSRYVMSGLIYQWTGATFPYGTLIVNVSGCLAIGFLSVLADEKFVLGPDLKVLLMAGFCGAYTTFSTLILETANLMKDGETVRAVVNLALSVAVGLLMFRVGMVLARLV